MSFLFLPRPNPSHGRRPTPPSRSPSSPTTSRRTDHTGSSSSPFFTSSSSRPCWDARSRPNRTNLHRLRPPVSELDAVVSELLRPLRPLHRLRGEQPVLKDPLPLSLSPCILAPSNTAAVVRSGDRRGCLRRPYGPERRHSVHLDTLLQIHAGEASRARQNECCVRDGAQRCRQSHDVMLTWAVISLIF